MDENICYFIPFHKDYHSIHTIHFVLETQPQPRTALKAEAVYKMHYVCKGQGLLHTIGKIQPIEEGDIFFTFAGSPYCIESKGKLNYMYISFIGQRGNMIMDKLDIHAHNALFHHAQQIEEIWKNGLSVRPEFSDLISEAVLLHTFAFLGNTLLPQARTDRQSDLTARIKKYVDDHFTEPTLTLEQISQALSYNRKYISSVFKKQMGLGLVEYLHTIRVQQACTMIEQGFTSVSDVANRCGCPDAQYFSKIFRRKMGLTPTAYLKSLTEARLQEEKAACEPQAVCAESLSDSKSLPDSDAYI